ncbi:hypothetical protein [Rhodopila globiformis]|uniref:hypothetical protein n=1 Tax=Rhodopila globiformis TaxID=1071 RepID=UPI001EFDCDAE|nr:hypothetical protein [Rhodopila globiformis]
MTPANRRSGTSGTAQARTFWTAGAGRHRHRQGQDLGEVTVQRGGQAVRRIRVRRQHNLLDQPAQHLGHFGPDVRIVERGFEVSDRCGVDVGGVRVQTHGR